MKGYILYRWVDLTGRVPPVALFVNSIKFADGKEQLDEVTMVANIIETPNVLPNEDLILYMTASNELRLQCTGLIGAKDVDVYFDPILYKEVAYEIVSKFPLADNELALRLRHGYEWRGTPGPLYVKGIDTGAGPVKVGGDAGVLVAKVQENLPYHDVTVDSTFLDQIIYYDEPSIYVSGTGFNPEGNTIRFANGILGKGVNFTITKVTETQMTLTLVPGSYWRGNVDNLPGYLTVLAVNAGDGFVAVGPINSAKGRDVATVFERPKVNPGTTKLYQTHSHELHIYGAGFTDVLATPMIKFRPELVVNDDYTIRVEDRDNMEITLKDGKKWGDVGPLMVQAINTRGDPNGWVVFPGNGVAVAQIVADEDATKSGGVVIYPLGTRVYQSVLQRVIQLNGEGFKAGMEITFDPPLAAGDDYDLSVLSATTATLTLRQGKRWRPEEGLLMAMQVKVDGSAFPLAGGSGIRVAVVLEDPVILPGSDNIHESQSKVIAIRGQGFTNVDDLSITLKPSDPTSFKVLSVMDSLVRLQLKPSLDWLPSYLHLNPEEDKKIPLEVLSINTGAGEVKLSSPVTVGYVIADRPGVVCDDSCEFAFDGVCDDGSEPNYDYYDDMYGDDFQYYATYGSEMRDGDGDGFDDDNFGYDDYYMEDDNYRVSACVRGTDCTDCGGVDAIIDYSQPPKPGSGAEVCSNTCIYARDGVCDDPRGENYCALGTDCQDCGPVGADNFTRIDDDGDRACIYNIFLQT